MTAALEKRIEDIAATGQAIVVKDQETLSAANELLLAISGIEREVDAAWDPVIAKAHESHREAIKAKRRFSDPLEALKKTVKYAIAGYLAAEKKKRDEAAAASFRAEQDRIRLEANTVRQMEAAEAQGRPEEADRILEDAAAKEAALVASAPAVPPRPEVVGIHTRETWTFKITDPALLPREYLVPDLVKIGRIVRAEKGSTRIPGVLAYAVAGIAESRAS